MKRRCGKSVHVHIVGKKPQPPRLLAHRELCTQPAMEDLYEQAPLSWTLGYTHGSEVGMDSIVPLRYGTQAVWTVSRTRRARPVGSAYCS